MSPPQVVMKRNEVMLEETRDTITVPASLMIRYFLGRRSRDVFFLQDAGKFESDSKRWSVLTNLTSAFSINGSVC